MHFLLVIDIKAIRYANVNIRCESGSVFLFRFILRSAKKSILNLLRNIGRRSTSKKKTKTNRLQLHSLSCGFALDSLAKRFHTEINRQDDFYWIFSVCCRCRRGFFLFSQLLSLSSSASLSLGQRSLISYLVDENVRSATETLKAVAEMLNANFLDSH